MKLRVAEVDHIHFVVDSTMTDYELDVPDEVGIRWRAAQVAWDALQSEILPFYSRAEHARGRHQHTYFDCAKLCGEDRDRGLDA